jgi:hypothetical protein
MWCHDWGVCVLKYLWNVVVDEKLTAQLGLSGPVCCDEFAMHKTTIFMVVHGRLHHRDVLVPVRRNASLQFLLVKRIFMVHNTILS